MPDPVEARRERRATTRSAARRAAREFVAIPTLVVAFFVALPFVARWLDGSDSSVVDSIRGWLSAQVVGDLKNAGDLLGTLAAGLLTVTSITFSLLLLAVQQSASTLTHAVLD